MRAFIRMIVEEFSRAARVMAAGYKTVKEIDDRTMATLFALFGRFK